MPASPDELRADWLEDALRRGGWKEARLRGFSAERIGEAYGWTSTIVRAALQGEGLPATVIVKWCSPANARTEARFACDVAPLLDVETPRVLGASIDETADRAVVVLADIAPARQGDYLVPMSDADLDVQVDAMASWHARFWDRADDPAIAWLPRRDPDVADRVRRTEAGLGVFLDRWGGRISAAARDAAAALPRRLASAYAALARAPLTLTHADFHVENVLFRPDGRAVVLDWTEAARARAAYDTARFLLNGVGAAARRRMADRAIPRWLHAVAARGVAGYGRADLERDLAWAFVVLAAGQVRSVSRTTPWPLHPHAQEVIPLEIANFAEAAGEWPPAP